ncbi:MAG TPA: LysR family transcriptional regulator [Burkholderiales bacterium]|nr:LysR family transcriptional regulator [Burkholderiales bacterium]
MSMRKLKALIAVADHGSLARAAHVLNLTQSAISMQIGALEDEFGMRLFDRGRKPLRLTADGVALLERAREVVRLYDELGESLSGADRLSGRLVIGAIPGALISIIPRALARLAELHPRLAVRVTNGISETLTMQLVHGELDAAIISEPRRLPDRLVWRPFASEPIMVIAPPGATYAGDVAALTSLPYIRYNRTFWVGRMIEAGLRSRGITLRAAMELDSQETIALMVRHGLGVSILPVCDTDLDVYANVTLLPFGDPPLHRRIGLAEARGSLKTRLAGALFAELLRASEQASRTRGG